LSGFLGVPKGQEHRRWGRGQKASEQWIFFAHGLVGHHGYPAVAWGGDECDDVAPSEKAEYAIARALDDGQQGRRTEEFRALRAAMGMPG
jgi:hypothetical protein